MTTIKDIAAKLNVTTATVSNALNGRTGKVSPAMRRQVQETAHAMGYQPHAAARALRTGHHHAAAVMVRTPQSPYYAEILHGLIGQILAHGYQALIRQIDWPDHPGVIKVPLSYLAADGIFLVDASQAALALPSDLRRLPVISLGAVDVATPFTEEAGDCVRVDLAAGARDAVRHLLNGGRRRIAFLVDAETQREREVRQTAYLTVMGEAERIPEILTAPGQSRAEARRFVQEYVARKGAPDSLFCINDEMAIGACRALRDLGLRVPQDVAVVGCDGVPEAEYADPPLTTIVQPILEMCRLAWQFLERRLQDPEAPPQQALLQATLTVRSSSDSQSLDFQTSDFQKGHLP